MNKEADVVSQKIGACGVFCGACEVFRHAEYRCYGCNWANRMLRISRESKKGCIFWECTQNKKVKCCFMCEEFPCQIHYDSREAVYAKQVLDSWKKLRKSGLTFWGRRKELESLLETENKKIDK